MFQSQRNFPCATFECVWKIRFLFAQRNFPKKKGWTHENWLYTIFFLRSVQIHLSLVAEVCGACWFCQRSYFENWKSVNSGRMKIKILIFDTFVGMAETSINWSTTNREKLMEWAQFFFHCLLYFGRGCVMSSFQRYSLIFLLPVSCYCGSEWNERGEIKWRAK